MGQIKDLPHILFGFWISNFKLLSTIHLTTTSWWRLSNIAVARFPIVDQCFCTRLIIWHRYIETALQLFRDGWTTPNSTSTIYTVTKIPPKPYFQRRGPLTPRPESSPWCHHSCHRQYSKYRPRMCIHTNNANVIHWLATAHLTSRMTSSYSFMSKMLWLCPFSCSHAFQPSNAIVVLLCR